jgi:hypothetical protein
MTSGARNAKPEPAGEGGEAVSGGVGAGVTGTVAGAAMVAVGSGPGDGVAIVHPTTSAASPATAILTSIRPIMPP